MYRIKIMITIPFDMSYIYILYIYMKVYHIPFGGPCRSYQPPRGPRGLCSTPEFAGMQGGMRGWTKKQSRKFHPNQHNACSSLRSTIHYQPGIPGMEEVHVGKTQAKKRIKKRDLPTRLAGWELLLFKCRHMFVLSRSLNHHPGQVLCATALLIHHMLMFHWTLQLSEHSLPVLIGYVQCKCLNRYHLKITWIWICMYSVCAHLIYIYIYRFFLNDASIHDLSTSISIANVLPFDCNLNRGWKPSFCLTS